MNVMGRYTVDVRICSCPKRDRIQEEKRIKGVRKEAVRVADGLARTNSSLVISNMSPSVGSHSNDTAACSKKRKIDNHGVEDMVLVPVSTHVVD